ncbi:putative quinol monooxygenase [Pelomonas sp. KK5]|uniref:putative quinol monooxygenase n=1 Tax=Pelomonas sp. KK5 TaxID=1855730 RepID=UPI00097C072E|nr:putative quinol monooxygenase [Pelomonas sp. KK5]
MHHVIARITALPGRAADMRSVLETLARATRDESGCLQYEVLQAQDQPELFSTFECWQDRGAADGHMATPHVAAAFAQAGPLLAAPPDIRHMQRC